MEAKREQPAGQGLALGAELLVEPAPVLGREEATGAVRALADARVAARQRIEGIRVRALGRILALAVVALGLRLPVGLHLPGCERDVPPPPAAAAALLAGETLFGVEHEGGHEGQSTVLD